MDHRTDLVATCRSSKVATGKVSAFGMAGNDGVAGNFRAAIFDAGPRGWGLHTQPYIDTHSHGHVRHTSSIHVCMQQRCQTYQTYQTSNPSPCHALQYIQVGEALAFIGEKIWLCFFLRELLAGWETEPFTLWAKSIAQPPKSQTSEIKVDFVDVRSRKHRSAAQVHECGRWSYSGADGEEACKIKWELARSRIKNVLRLKLEDGKTFCRLWLPTRLGRYCSLEDQRKIPVLKTK